ncbi:MAG TPA: hypothetical protein VET48_09125 [Steroidobacteraceae bacterium]|nr:hypothetical protein [Steroidobacteraceae bacterium]
MGAATQLENTLNVHWLCTVAYKAASVISPMILFSEQRYGGAADNSKAAAYLPA